MRIVGLMSVVETPEFLSASAAMFDEDDRSLLISYLAARPLAGGLIANTGGIRKLRWALESAGGPGCERARRAEGHCEAVSKDL